ncbi:hypothetical protein [Halorhodospira halophila]|uniref:hypothetical protein n=1 Tax=Halorhodospira halophila TaxID=1053 RepID=UPI00059F596B|nr:hypothetical protein [Halorhodospira halophila]MBK1730006.1 hypothetical protein [Halorhodospira halophila]
MKVTIEVDLTPQEAQELMSGSAESALAFQQQFLEAVSQEVARQLTRQWEQWPRPPWAPGTGSHTE